MIKIILSTGSQFFRDIFMTNQHPHPIIYLQIKCSDLEALVRFIYLGECEVEQENVDQILKLGIEGLVKRESGGLVKGEEARLSEYKPV